jgi:hypothetical protein
LSAADNQPSLALFPNWPLRLHLAAWRKQHKGDDLTGKRFVAPDGQAFRVTGKMFWRLNPRRKRPAVSLVWQSRCKVCDAPYTFNKLMGAPSLIRTCPSHRRQATRHRSPLRDLVTGELEALVLAGASATHEAFIARCVARVAPPRSGRDTRRQRVVRVCQELIDNRQLPQGIRATGDAFESC